MFIFGGMELKHVFFDLDHTLWDFDKNSELCFQQIFADYKIEIKLDEFLEIYNPINRAYWKRYREDKVSKADLRYGRFKDTFDALNYKISDVLINTMSNKYIEDLSKHNYLINGALDVLNYLDQKYEIHIITNGFTEVQDLKLAKSKIKKYFSTITTSEHVGVKKPNSKIFEYALAQAKASKEESVMIGDDLEADIEGAFWFGIQPIYFDLYKKNESTNYITINSLLELKQYL